MQSIPSAQFRKTYSQIDEPTVVTANGHIIGVWYPKSEGLYQLTGAEPPDEREIAAARESIQSGVLPANVKPVFGPEYHPTDLPATDPFAPLSTPGPIKVKRLTADQQRNEWLNKMNRSEK